MFILVAPHLLPLPLDFPPSSCCFEIIIKLQISFLFIKKRKKKKKVGEKKSSSRSQKEAQ